MKIVIRFLTLTILLITLNGCEKEPPKLKGWILIWNDEFEDPALDSTKWRALTRTSSYNEEQQAYLPQNITIKDGCLVFTSNKESYTGDDNFNPGNTVTRSYTSGLVDSYGKFSFKYGRVEIRAKLPKTKGIWPAHWLLPEDNTWPPEIDIMEMLGDNPKTVYFANHWGADPKHHYSYGSDPINGPNFSKRFHTFMIEWKPGIIHWFIDNKLKFASSKGVSDKTMYILLNTAVGGSWPGNPDQTTLFPQKHRIDYIRVYQTTE